MIRTIGIFIMAAALFTACESGPAKGDTGVVEQGTVDNSPEAQLRALNLQIADNPGNHILFQQRAILLHDRGDTKGAIKDVEEAQRLNPNEPELNYLRGFFAYTQNDLATALGEFRIAAQKGSINPENFYAMGQIFFLQKQYSLALERFDEAVKLDSLEPTYVFARGFLFEEQNKLKEAEAAYRKAIQLDSTFVKGYSMLHDLYLDKRKDEKAALEWNDRLLAVIPDHPLGWFNKGKGHYRAALAAKDDARTAQLEQAITAFGNSIASDPSFQQALYNRGYCYFLLEKLDEAIRDFEAVTILNPGHAQAWFMLGSIHEKYQDYESALDFYSRALLAKPDFKEAEEGVLEMKKKLEQK
jgi:superkiller protein 3